MAAGIVAVVLLLLVLLIEGLVTAGLKLGTNVRRSIFGGISGGTSDVFGSSGVDGADTFRGGQLTSLLASIVASDDAIDAHLDALGGGTSGIDVGCIVLAG